MKKHHRLAVFALATMAAASSVRADTYGKLEHVRVMAPIPIEVVAKFDAGTEQTSLHAVNVKYFQRDGDTWVRFTIDNGSVLPGNRVTLERPVLKDVKVKQAGGGVEHRPLVEMELCVGDRSFKSKLSVSDRTGYTAPLLIGKSELAQLGAVDGARQFTHEPSCKPSDAQQAPTGSKAEPVSGSARPQASSGESSLSSAPKALIADVSSGAFSCDGRTYCSEMRSCAEATYFLKNCPNTKMDGDKNGVPCEKQWCR